MKRSTMASDRTRYGLRVISTGICCAVGYSAAAANCALRAGMDHFQESDFRTRSGDLVRVARLPEQRLWGAPRLAQWMRQAMEDCLANATLPPDEPLLVLLVFAEAERPAAEERHAVQAAALIRPALGHPLHPASSGTAAGRAGLAECLTYADKLLREGAVRHAMVVGFDSYLHSEVINHYLSQDRLLVPGNRDGFIPGEAAAAVLLDLAAPETPGLHIAGWGQGMEEGRPDGSVPSRSRGLTQALRTAFGQAGIDCNDLAFRLSDQNGEGFFASDATNAFTRVAVDGGTTPMVLTTADCTGEVGAATGPLMLAWLHHLLPRADGPGHCGVLHLANDEGLRAAVVVRYQPPARS